MFVVWTVAAESASVDASCSVDVAQLFDVHGPFLLRTLVRLVHDETVAEDMAQEVFLIAHRRRHELSAERNVGAWLYRVAQNVAWRHRRTFARRARLADRAAHEPAPPSVGDPERAQALRDEASRVRLALATLPRGQREVFVLFELEEKSGEECAHLLGIPIATVWTRLSRARARLRASWAALGGADA